MTLQYRDAKNGQIVWRDYTVDGEVLKSPVDIDKLPFGVYRLIAPWQHCPFSDPTCRGVLISKLI